MGTAGLSVTLANSIIGVGILAMPFCFQQCGVVLATLILLFMGLVSRLCCYFLLKSALIARRRNFEFLAFHVFGPAGKLAVEVGIIGFLMGTCIAYFVVVGDLGPQIIAKMFNINQSDILRTSIMVIVSLVCVLPLGLLRNVDSLSNVSAATIGFYFCLVIKVISEAASCMWSHEWQSAVQLWRPAGLLQCVPIFSMALFCQTQLFEIFESLPTLSLEKMNVVTKNAINICTGVYFTLGLFGYIAFHSHNISGNILMSLSPTWASDAIKLGFVMSVAFSFPLIIFPCRASMYSFLYKKIHAAHHDHIINNSIPERSFRCITVAIIAVSLFISLLIPDIELVLGLVGSTIGVLVCVVFPAACFVNLTFKDTNERLLAKGVIVLGLVILILGTYANLQAAETKLDDKITQERIDKIVEDFFERMEQNDAVRPVSKENVEGDKLEVQKKDEMDSEIQPPNPVPPDSISVEKQVNKAKQLETKENKEIDPKLVPVENVGEKASEIRPKNLQNKLNGEKIINEEKKSNPDEKTKDEVKPSKDKTQEKIDIIKQQKLIETIKQHGEEQKELIKEQKEILNELVKAKKELEQKKKDVEKVDAQKLAVESIQQIANVAIKSLSGVTEPPKGEQKVENVDVLQKIADEAKKAIEAIAELKDKETVKDENKNIKQNVVKTGDSEKTRNLLNNGGNNLPKENNVPIQNPQVIMSKTDQQIQNVQNNIPDPNSQPNKDKFAPINPPVVQIKNERPVNAEAILHNKVLSENIVPALNVQQPQVGSNIVHPVKVGQNDELVNNILNQPAAIVNQAAQNGQPSPQLSQYQQVQNQQTNQEQNELKVENEKKQEKINQEQFEVANANLPQPHKEPVQKQLKQNEAAKPHSHSPDEPQSYKVGEDLQTAEMAKNVVENIPIPVAIGKSKAQEIQTNNLNKETHKDSIQNLQANSIQNVANDAKANNVIEVNEGPVRHKREVVDCTKRSLLSPEDIEICKVLLVNNIAKNEKVEINTEKNEKIDNIIAINKYIEIQPIIKIDPQRKSFADKPIANNFRIEIKSSEILPTKVDLNEGLNLLPMALIHHGRSLKSYDENKRKR